MSTLFWVLLTLALIVLASVTTVVVIVWAVLRRIRRSRVLAGVVLRNRARFRWGPQRRVLALRVQLRDVLESGRAAIDLSVRSNGRRGELPRLFRRIETEGLALDAQLRLMESETDTALLAEQTRAAGLRVEQVADMIHGLRASVASGLDDPSDDTLTTLRSDVDREVVALHAGLVELRNLNASDPHVGAFLSSPDRLQTKGASS